jgi:DNA-binding transcriptional ArsR family regulator
MTDSGETIYSTMFSSLKHPARRKILRMLFEKALSFSELLEAIEVSSSHLTYHLESLGELISKTQAGKYKLSTFGEAAVNTMRLVEDAPAVQSQNRKYRSLRWKPILAALIIGIILVASFSVLQYNTQNQLSAEYTKLQERYDRLLSLTGSTDKAINFLRDVAELDLTKYDATLLSNTIGPSDLDGVTEQTISYRLIGVESRMEVLLRFRNNVLSMYKVSLLDGSPIYVGAQPFGVLGSAKWLLEKLKLYEDASYLNDMSSILARFGDEANEIDMTEGNLKFNVSVSGVDTEVNWYFTDNRVDFTQKGLKLVFENQVLKELNDGYYLFKIGNTNVNVNVNDAIQTARNAVKGFTWTGDNGQTVFGYTVLEEPVSAVFHPLPRDDPLTLVPCWVVTLYLDDVYPTNVNRLSVGVWADTGAVGQRKPLTG